MYPSLLKLPPLFKPEELVLVLILLHLSSKNCLYSILAVCQFSVSSILLRCKAQPKRTKPLFGAASFFRWHCGTEYGEWVNFTLNLHSAVTLLTVIWWPISAKQINKPKTWQQIRKYNKNTTANSETLQQIQQQKNMSSEVLPCHRLTHTAICMWCSTRTYRFHFKLMLICWISCCFGFVVGFSYLLLCFWVVHVLLYCTVTGPLCSTMWKAVSGFTNPFIPLLLIYTQISYRG